MFFSETKSMFLFQQNRRLKMFLFPSETLGWRSSGAMFFGARIYSMVLQQFDLHFVGRNQTMTLKKIPSLEAGVEKCRPTEMQYFELSFPAS